MNTGRVRPALSLTALLGVPIFYRAFARLVNGDARAIYQREYLRAMPGERVLDIGCGPADMLEALPPNITYVGFDGSAEYIDAARRRYGERGRFELRHITPDSLKEFEGFDLVMANGVLHHLDDAGANELFRIARVALRAEGRLVTLDGCYTSQQSVIARYLLSRDRGRFVRTALAYEALARAHFPRVVAHLRHDLLRIPYTHLIMECRP
jgi:SAM-dependent methyltransferase